MKKYILPYLPKARDIMYQAFFPFPIYKEGANGEKVVDKTATYIARALSLIGATCALYVIFGIRISKLIHIIETILGY